MIGMAHEQIGTFYPGFACLTALAFFASAAYLWGYCGVIGTAFLALAFAMLIDLTYAPFLFGVAWAVVLVVMGRRLKQAGSPPTAASAQSHTDSGPTLTGNFRP